MVLVAVKMWTVVIFVVTPCRSHLGAYHDGIATIDDSRQLHYNGTQIE